MSKDVSYLLLTEPQCTTDHLGAIRQLQACSCLCTIVASCSVIMGWSFTRVVICWAAAVTVVLWLLYNMYTQGPKNWLVRPGRYAGQYPGSIWRYFACIYDALCCSFFAVSAATLAPHLSATVCHAVAADSLTISLTADSRSMCYNWRALFMLLVVDTVLFALSTALLIEPVGSIRHLLPGSLKTDTTSPAKGVGESNAVVITIKADHGVAAASA